MLPVNLELPDLARNHLLPGSAFFMGDYLGLASASPEVVNMVELLRSNRPLGSNNDEVWRLFIGR
ncbi:MAG: hypothetical protein CM1200mP29_12310 [Verrucomicrobiota bacterium]|nr:MAG: hypothetical protein CM1200mP29_12310 [Verrucomicrobiota bacterium]